MRQIEARRPSAAARRTSSPYGSYDCWIIADMSSRAADSLRHGDMKRTPAAFAANVSNHRQEVCHEQNELCRTLRDALRRSRADGEVLSKGIWLADPDARGGNGQLCPRHDHRKE